MNLRLEQLRSDGRLFSSRPSLGRLELIEVGEIQGQNSCLSEFQAALLLDRLGHLDAQNEQRREFVEALAIELLECGVAELPPMDIRIDQCTYYNLLLKPNPKKFAQNSIDAIARALTAELGLQVSPIYRPLNRHPLYCPLRSSRVKGDKRRAEIDPSRFSLPNAASARQQFITFPNWALLSGTHGVDDLVQALQKVAHHSKVLTAVDQSSDLSAF